MYSYRTLQEPAEGQYKEQGSRFLSFAFPVSNESQIKEHLARLQKEYYDARHHCYAWMLGPEKKNFRAFDGGEPNHSAGDPILGQIRSKDVTNVLVVVVRYFGGVKLGIGGLVAAYKTAATVALENAIIVEREIVEQISIVYPYSSTPEVSRLIKDLGLVVVEQNFQEACHVTFQYGTRHKQKLFEKLQYLSDMGLITH